MNDRKTPTHDEQPDWRDALAAVREAIDIPYPLTAADEETYQAILDRRLMQTRVTVRAILDAGDAGDAEDVAWHVAYLRKQLAAMPAVGYAQYERGAR